MPTYKTKGIILRRTSLREADKIITIYTHSMGKVRAVAHGVSKINSKLAAHLELFSLGDFMLAEGKNMDTVASAVTINNFSNLQKDLDKTSLAYFIVELVEKLTPDEHRDSRIFNLLVAVFEDLSKESLKDKRRMRVLVHAFEVKFLNLIGFSPDFKHCVVCGRDLTPDGNYFSATEGGVVDASCRGNLADLGPISNEALKVLRMFSRENLDQSTRLKINGDLLKEVERIIGEYLQFVAERKLHSIDFIKKVENLI